jgi:hypothetical protein
MFDALFKELGLQRAADWNDSFEEKFVSTLGSALGKSTADVQSAAQRAYQAIFGRAMPSYERKELK